jgi:predicted transcriptional regulator
MNISVVGNNAGLVWKTLGQTPNISRKAIIRKTGLKQREVDLALGWLARENKLVVSERSGIQNTVFSVYSSRD